MKIYETTFPCGRRFVLENEYLTAAVIETGAALQDLVFNGKHVALGFDTADEYRRNSCYVGAIVGRYANRIGGARFTLNGEEYILDANEGKNQLHGGKRDSSWHERDWHGEIAGDKVVFTLESHEYDNGFPGSMTVKVSYSLEGSKLRIDFEGTSDADTVFAPTSHAYFNLHGGNVLDTELKLSASGHLEVDEGLIPTGKILPCDGSFDFSEMKKIAVPFDDCFVVSDSHMLSARAGGIQLDLYSDLPAVQVYTGEFLAGKYKPFTGFAVEPEIFPDSPNKPEFPSCVLKAGETAKHYAEYSFTTV